MITLFTGMPGAGKTAAMVDLLSQLPGDRPIYVDGLNGLKIPHTVCDASKWHEELPDGAILVIDEVQRVWRPRGSTSKVPDSVAALETHRHNAIDVYMTTQAPRLCDANVRGLVGRHVHIRDTGWLGRHWYEWPECSESLAWKTCPVKKSYKLPKKIFGLYQSAVEHTKPIRMVPPALYWAIAFIVFAIIAGTMAYRTFSKPIDAPAPATAAAEIQATNQTQQPMSDGTISIDDRVDWIPRVSNKPESAPAYDAVRVVAIMPLVVGGACMGVNCKCYTEQGTDAGLSPDECRQWIKNPPFNPYKPDSEKARNQTPLVQPQPAPASEPLQEGHRFPTVTAKQGFHEPG